MKVVAAAGFFAWVSLAASSGYALDGPKLGGKRVSFDLSNTSVFQYRFNNRNDRPVNPAAPTLNPAEHVDDNYGEWFNQFYLRTFWDRLSVGMRLDSAVYMATLSRDDSQQLIIDQLGKADLNLENRFGRELNSRYASFLYPAKLWVQYKYKWLHATVGDFYSHLGRGLVFSVRKIDEVGIDTTVRGAKLRIKKRFGSFRFEGTAFGGQLNPIRLDFPTGRVLTGSGSPLFFLFPGTGGAAFPQTRDFQYFSSNPVPGGEEFLPRTDRAKPNYLEDSVVGGTIKLGHRRLQVGLNGAVLLRQGNSEDQQRCIAAGTVADDCQAEHPSFRQTEATRSHDQIRAASVSVRIPPIKGIVDGYVEGAIQHQVDGQVSSIDATGNTLADEDVFGYGIYANVNITAGPVTAAIEGKHYRSFFPIGSNVDQGTQLGYAAPEFNIVQYSRPPNAQSIYTQPIGNPDVCNTGGRGRVDLSLNRHLKVYGWVGRYVSYTELDDKNNKCSTDPSKRTDTWDTAAGTELELQGGKTHHSLWIGARLTDRPISELVNPELKGPTSVFYREGYVRYNLNQHLYGNFSLSAVGYHWKRYEPSALAEPWHEGENLLSLNWNPNFSFIFGYEYQTRPGFPTHYFNGAIQYRSKDRSSWHGRLMDVVRLYVGQRRAALRCVGGVCRIYPAFEGGRFELISRF